MRTLNVDLKMTFLTHPKVLQNMRSMFDTVRNPNVSLSPTLAKNEKVEHYIRIKTNRPIALRFWVESGVSVLCG